MHNEKIIGLDLDNTIIDYSQLIANIAAPLIGTNFNGKKEIRDAIREFYSDSEWNRIQGMIYGSRINEAQLTQGLEEFLDKCLTSNFHIDIISHKSKYAKVDPTNTDLRIAAMNFLKEKGITKYIPESQIYFESGTNEKIQRIINQNCTTFVDDLEEVLMHDAFPQSTQKLLYINPTPKKILEGITICKDWNEVYSAIINQ